MKKITLALAALLLLPSALFAEAESKGEEQVRQLNSKEVEAFLAKDAKALADIWSDDFVVTNPLNKLAKKQDVLGMVKSGVLSFKSYERKIEYVHTYGNMVVVAGSENVVWAGKMPLAGKPSALRFTSLWLEQDGRWQQVARHANIVPPPH